MADPLFASAQSPAGEGVHVTRMLQENTNRRRRKSFPPPPALAAVTQRTRLMFPWLPQVFAGQTESTVRWFDDAGTLQSSTIIEPFLDLSVAIGRPALQAATSLRVAMPRPRQPTKRTGTQQNREAERQREAEDQSEEEQQDYGGTVGVATGTTGGDPRLPVGHYSKAPAQRAAKTERQSKKAAKAQRKEQKRNVRKATKEVRPRPCRLAVGAGAEGGPPRVPD